jgi:hypothetical protein
MEALTLHKAFSWAGAFALESTLTSENRFWRGESLLAGKIGAKAPPQLGYTQGVRPSRTLKAIVGSRSEDFAVNRVRLPCRSANPPPAVTNCSIPTCA